MSAAAPLVSVVLPTYNRAASLEAAAVSVLSQDAGDLELIVVDDASSDRTSEILASLALDPRVTVVRQPNNRGAGVARNAGLARARGRYVAFQDSDDLWLPGMLSILLTALSNSGEAVGVCYGTTLKQGRFGTSALPGRWVRQRSGDLALALARGNFIGLPATLTRRSVFDTVGGFDPALATLEDWELWLRVAKVTAFAFVDAVLVRSATSASGTNALSQATLEAVARIGSLHAELYGSDPAAAAQLSYLRGASLAALGDRRGARLQLMEARRLSSSGKIRLAAAASRLGPRAVTHALAAAKWLASIDRHGGPVVGRGHFVRGARSAPAATSASGEPPPAHVVPTEGASVAVVVPTRNPGGDASRLVAALARQSLEAAERVVVDSESRDNSVDVFAAAGWRVLPTSASRFRHGRARNAAARATSSDILVFMTQDVEPEADCLERLVAPIVAGRAVASYARQMPFPDAGPMERFARSRNYPSPSAPSGPEGAEGVRAFFFSNACSAVRADVFWELGGFPEQVIMNEDMNLAARLLAGGHRIAYCPDAVVRHSHSYSMTQTFRRYFDVGVALSQSDPVLRDAATMGAGLGYVRALLAHLVREGRADLLPVALAESAVKWMGHFLGRRHAWLPTAACRAMSLHRAYWDDGAGRAPASI